MRKAILVVLASLLVFALAGTAEARCISCNIPCEDIYGPNFECGDDDGGPYGDCHNLVPCRGCRGWFNQDCFFFGSNDVKPQEPEPLLGVQHVTSVVVRHDSRSPEPVQLALAH